MVKQQNQKKKKKPNKRAVKQLEREKREKKYLVPRCSQPDCWYRCHSSLRSDRLQNHCAPMAEWKQGYCLRSQHPQASSHPTCTQIKHDRQTFQRAVQQRKKPAGMKKKHHYFIFKINHFRCTTEKGYSRLAMTSLRYWSSFPGATIIRSHDNLSCLLCHQLRGKSLLHEHKVWPKRGWLSRLYWGCQPKWEHSPCFQSKMMTKSCQ